MNNPLAPGSTIGILGGGQLGRMLAIAASRLGMKTVIFEPGSNAPAAQVANQVICAPYSDKKALITFCSMVDVVTYEFENIPSEALDTIKNLLPIWPDQKVLKISQDRLVEKEFLQGLGLTVAPYAKVDSLDELTAAIETIGLPAILKTRRFGYDGKGQSKLTKEKHIVDAYSNLAGASGILEGFVNFEREISVIASRGIDGEVACFDPGENVHIDGILHTTTVPANLSHAHQTDAIVLAGQILNALNYVGVLGVELFVTSNGLIVNEIAPRVHNSGHWTQNACQIDQFEQHIRAICGWPLGDGTRHSDAVMTNIIGDQAGGYLDHTNAALHMYGKEETREGRKMGHINRISPLGTGAA